MELAKRLREETAAAHAAAEGAAFVRCFIQGAIDRRTYALHLAALLPVYRSLERCLYETREHPLVAPIYFPELNRSPALEEDLAFFFGADWATEAQHGPTAGRYADRIRAAAAEEPGLLAAHAYVRYLGDLSGGQALKKVARRALDLNETEGTAFYEFPAVGDFKSFKDEYRARLSGLPVDENLAGRIANEAKLAFELNGAIFGELETELANNIGRTRYEAALAGGR